MSKTQDGKRKDRELVVFERKSILINLSCARQPGPLSIFKKAEFFNRPLLGIKSNYIKSNKSDKIQQTVLGTPGSCNAEFPCSQRS